jgi:hypothetical protein
VSFLDDLRRRRKPNPSQEPKVRHPRSHKVDEM